MSQGESEIRSVKHGGISEPMNYWQILAVWFSTGTKAPCSVPFVPPVDCFNGANTCTTILQVNILNLQICSCEARLKATKWMNIDVCIKLCWLIIKTIPLPQISSAELRTSKWQTQQFSKQQTENCFTSQIKYPKRLGNHVNMWKAILTCAPLCDEAADALCSQYHNPAFD